MAGRPEPGKNDIRTARLSWPPARLDLTITESAVGPPLMVTKSGSNVDLDWSADAGAGLYIVKPATSRDFSPAASLAAPLPGKIYDDPVLGSLARDRELLYLL